MQGTPDADPPWAWLLGTSPAQRLRISQSLLAFALMLCCTLVMLYAGALAGTPRKFLLLWTVATLGWPVLVWALIRSGWSQRLQDPALTQWQMVFSLVMAGCAYPMAGVLRPLVLSVVALVLAFGMFNLRLVQALRMAWLGLLLLALSMAFSLWVWPRRFPAAEELGIFMMALIALPGMALLAGRLEEMRQRLRAQRRSLNEALARIEELATRDMLTGLYNRRHGEELLRQALLRRRRSGTPFSVAMIDLDHFKRFNDQHGHAVGDAVLRAFAQAALSALRATDTLTRWGGEEFLLLLNDADQESAGIALQRIQVAVEQAAVEANGQALGFTFSAGATCHVEGESELLLLDRADRALYRAKAQGRNRVLFG